ncbi:nuclear pore complex protein nup93 [Anaeramoeba flamelloides]|uniref:Nuclear pore complex protein nup93 n=1 Tax=Anaeramoeba flamelloides TaxID=1746091 RepID=A0AAV8AAL1_9EUKA|nr:nuclear pore complex protein nup93 [Anaeramoeba flamelloides]
MSFSTLFDQSEQLTRKLTGDVSHLQRSNIEQITKDCAQQIKTSYKPSRMNLSRIHRKGQYLLSKRGFDVDKLYREIDTLRVQKPKRKTISQSFYENAGKEKNKKEQEKENEKENEKEKEKEKSKSDQEIITHDLSIYLSELNNRAITKIEKTIEQSRKQDFILQTFEHADESWFDTKKKLFNLTFSKHTLGSEILNLGEELTTDMNNKSKNNWDDDDYFAFNSNDFNSNDLFGNNNDEEDNENKQYFSKLKKKKITLNSYLVRNKLVCYARGLIKLDSINSPNDTKNKNQEINFEGGKEKEKEKENSENEKEKEKTKKTKKNKKNISKIMYFCSKKIEKNIKEIKKINSKTKKIIINEPFSKVQGELSEISDLWGLLIYYEKHLFLQKYFQTKKDIRQSFIIQEEPKVYEILIEGTKLFLQNTYQNLVYNQCYDHYPELDYQDMDFLDLIKLFLTIKFNVNNEDDWPEYLSDINQGYPFWAIVYYCLRCGNTDAIVSLFENIQTLHKKGILQNTIEIEIFHFFQNYQQNNERISREYKNHLSNQYKKQFRYSNDPYKKAVYNIIGRCEHNSVNPVVESIEDYLWFQLKLVDNISTRESSLSPDSFTYQALQKKIVEIGPHHWNNKGSHPLKYFRVLLITLQFEIAIAYLYSIKNFQIDAIHFAIILESLGLLRINFSKKHLLTKNSFQSPYQKQKQSSSSSSSSFLLSSSKKNKNDIGYKNSSLTNAYQHLSNNNKKKIGIDLKNNLLKKNIHSKYLFDFDMMIRQFTSSLISIADYLSNDDIRIIINYIKLFKKQKTRLSNLKELALKTKNFYLLFGKLQPNGKRKKSQLEVFLGENIMENLIKKTAIESENQGKPQDAIILFDLIGDHKSVIDLLAKQISYYLTDQSIERKEFIQLAHDITKRYAEKNIFSKLSNRRSTNNLQILLGLQIQNLDLIPLKTDEIDIYVRKFNNLDEIIVRNFEKVLVAVMTILYRKYTNYEEKLKYSFDQSEFENKFQKIGEKANRLMLFSSLISLRMSTEVNSKLIRMQVLMK